MSRRRSSIFSFFDQKRDVDTVKSKEVPTNPYLKTLYEQSNILKQTALSVQQRKNAAEKIAYLFYLGGGVIEPSMNKDSQIIDIVLNIIMDSNEEYEVKLVIFHPIMIESIRAAQCNNAMR